MSCLCLVIRPGASSVDPDWPPAFDKLGIKSICVSRSSFVRGLLAQMRFDVILIDDGESHENTRARLLELVEFGTPVLVLRRAFSERQEVELLEAGASEVIDHGASFHLIGLKIAKAARPRHEAPQAANRASLRVGPLKLNPRHLLASVGDVPLSLTERQFDLLFFLASSAGRFVHRSLLDRGTGADNGDARRGVDMQISRIRKCLRAAGNSTLAIQSVYRYGYCLTVLGEKADALTEAC